MANRAIINTVGKIGASLLLPTALFLISPTWLERQPSLCLSQLVFNRSCPGCGITRALAWSLHGDFGKAWRYNKRIVIVLPLLGLVWLRMLMDGWHELIKIARSHYSKMANRSISTGYEERGLN